MTTPSIVNPLDAPHLKHLKALLRELEGESPRGEVLISTAILDEQLMECLLARLVDHKDVKKLVSGFNAPLGTFAARIVSCFSLGCISQDEFDDLELLRKIRNKFAHSLQASFDEEKISNWTAKLIYAVQSSGDLEVSPHIKFRNAAIALINNLTNRAHYVSKRRLSFEEWPF